MTRLRGFSLTRAGGDRRWSNAVVWSSGELLLLAGLRRSHLSLSLHLRRLSLLLLIQLQCRRLCLGLSLVLHVWRASSVLLHRILLLLHELELRLCLSIGQLERQTTSTRCVLLCGCNGSHLVSQLLLLRRCRRRRQLSVVLLLLRGCQRR